MTTQQLQQSFEWCKLHTDPDAWEALAIAFYSKGFMLNALYCQRQADNLLSKISCPLCKSRTPHSYERHLQELYKATE